MKYILFYVENCEPKVKLFKTKAKADSFVESFKEFKEDQQDNWIDMVVKGEIIDIPNMSAYYKEQLGK